MIPPPPHGDRNLGTIAVRVPLHDHYVLDDVDTLDRLIRVPLQRHDTAAAVPSVARNDDLGRGILDPVAQRLRREPSEHDGVRRPDPRAGEHGDRGLGDHRQIDRDAVTLVDAQAFQGVGEA
jgi:hypothetical protein